jgi:hypothetical protein
MFDSGSYKNARYFVILWLFPLRYVTLTALSGRCLDMTKALHVDSFGMGDQSVRDDLSPEIACIQERAPYDRVAIEMQGTYRIMVCSIEIQYSICLP